MYHQKYVDYVELLWEDFTYQIDNKVYKKQEKMYYPRFTKVIIHHFLIQEKSLSWRNRIGMHTSKDDYLINTLRFVSRKEASQIYGAVLPECLTSLEMKESKAYKTYLGYATGEVPPKVARKFKKASPSKKESELVPRDEEPIKKGKRLKTSAKKSASKPATCIVIRESPVETKSKRKEKEKVDVAHGKGIELLSEVALSEKAQMKEVRKKSLRDFHKTHPSGSGTVAEKPPSVEKITPTVTSEGTGDKPGVPDVTNDDSSESESESWGNDEDDSNNEQESSDESKEEEFVHTPTDDKDDDNLESESDDVIKSDEEKGIDDTTYQFDDDGNKNWENTQEQVVEDANVDKFPTGYEETGVPDVNVHMKSKNSGIHSLTFTSFCYHESSPVFINIPQSSQTFTPPPILTTPNPSPTIETTNPLSTLLDFALVFRFNDRIKELEKEVAELKKDPLYTQVITLVDEHLDTRLGETKEEFMKFLSESLIIRIKEQVKDQLPQILPKEVSNFAPPMIKKLIKESRDEVTLAKVSSQPHSTYEAASTLTEFELKKILIDKIEKTWHEKDKVKDKGPSAGIRTDGNKSQPKPSEKSVQSDELVFKVADSDMPQDQEWNPSDNDGNHRKKDAYRSDLVHGNQEEMYILQKRILAVTHVKVMRKHGYGYLEEIVVRRADNVLYRFKEGDFPRLQINDIEDMLLLVRQQLDSQNSFWKASFFARRHYQEYRHGILAEEKMEHIGKLKSLFHDQGHQQAAKGKEDDEEFGEIYWR
ncbi:hypothetical protein Tco_0893720 [Tanacetum coccineum]|uniref:Ubinuclein middle domain-containing protein n=1 Tax=Tanacetum coccineum TaxID=301880 RepID=A0ABQ5CAZ8_9ASTR